MIIQGNSITITNNSLKILIVIIHLGNCRVANYTQSVAHYDEKCYGLNKRTLEEVRAICD